MYAKYVYNAGSTVANVLSDVTALLTGESDLNNLSTRCNKGQSALVADVAAGWLLHDATAGTNARALKAPLADNPNAFKFVVLDFNTSGYVLTKVYETWNNTTHTGTNLCANSDQTPFSQRLDLTNGGVLHLCASARFLMIASFYGGTWGSSSYNGPSGCFERTRVCPWDTVAAGWPPFIFANLGYWAYNDTSATSPRKPSRTGAILTGASAGLNANVIPFGSLSWFMTNLSGVDQKVPDDAGGSFIPFSPILLVDSGNMPMHYGEITSLCDLWVLPQGVAANLDVIQKSGVNYLCLQAQTSGKMFAVRKG
ncbi:MAG: hypothetical protein HQL76_05825 [Magnetococcales bacterium]|nr:hypothetical protein [Magnetococcales bacterium]